MVAVQDIAPIDYSYKYNKLACLVSIYVRLLRQAWACWNKGTKQKTIFTQAILKVMRLGDTN
jgi:hypothetical protein